MIINLKIMLPLTKIEPKHLTKTNSIDYVHCNTNLKLFLCGISQHLFISEHTVAAKVGKVLPKCL